MIGTDRKNKNLSTTLALALVLALAGVPSSSRNLRSFVEESPTQPQSPLAPSMLEPETPLSPKNIFWCGYDKRTIFTQLFPEYKDALFPPPPTTAVNATNPTPSIPPINVVKLTRQTASLAQRGDILVMGMGGYCDGWGKNKIDSSWMEQNFNDTVTVIWFNLEPFAPFGGPDGIPIHNPKAMANYNKQNNDDNNNDNDNNNNMRRKKDGHVPKKHYILGFQQQDDGCSSAATRVHSMAMFFAEHYQHHERYRDALLFEGTRKKPINTGEKFLLYAAKNCVGFREDAFDEIALLASKHKLTNPNNPSEPVTVDYHGCRGNTELNNKVQIRLPFQMTSNYEAMQRYRFCLVLENTNRPGYVSEKILLAFLGGCVPIYYGSPEIFDIFNPKSFLYYNISNPQPTLDKILYLERHPSAYQRMLTQEPILKDGNNTIHKYFSLTDDIIHRYMPSLASPSFKSQEMSSSTAAAAAEGHNSYGNPTLKQRIRDMILNKDRKKDCATSTTARTV